jgi:hypothetical protein
VKLEIAEHLTLMGRPESWDGWSGSPLGECPDSVLRSARGFFRKLISEGTKSVRVQQQLEAIALVLEDREARSPQQSLSL